MKLLLDTADAVEIRQIADVLKIDGITTNPKILALANMKPSEALEKITKLMGEEIPVHVQVVGTEYSDIIKDALFLSKLRKNLYVKIPVTWDGFRAIKELAGQGLNITATTIYTVHQGLLAAKAGAKYVAPYTNNLDAISADGVVNVKKLVKILELYGYETKVLAVSFKNSQQVLGLMEAGVHSITVTPDTVREMASHPMTALSVGIFTNAWEAAFGSGGLDS